MDVLSALHDVRQDLQPALGLDHLQPLHLVVHGQSGRVIAPVFQPGQAVQQDGGRLFRSNESDDTAHSSYLQLIHSPALTSEADFTQNLVGHYIIFLRQRPVLSAAERDGPAVRPPRFGLDYLFWALRA